MILHSFIVSIKMNKDAINMDMARTLAESKIEELKDTSSSKFNYGQITTTQSIYYDIEWQETTKDAAIFQLEANITKTAIEDKMNVFKPNTYLEGGHRHNMVNSAPYTLVVVVPNGSNKNQREYLVGVIDSEINDRLFEMFTETYNENLDKLDSVENFGQNIGSVISKTCTKNKTYTDRNGNKYDNYNPYDVGKKQNKGSSSSEKGKIAERIDNKEFLESLPIKVYFSEKTIVGYDEFNIQILNLTDRNIDFYIDYERDFSKNRKPKEVLKSEVVGGLSAQVQTGDVNIIYTYTRQKNNSDTYNMAVNVKDLRDNSKMIALENNKYDNLYER